MKPILHLSLFLNLRVAALEKFTLECCGGLPPPSAHGMAWRYAKFVPGAMLPSPLSGGSRLSSGARERKSPAVRRDFFYWFEYVSKVVLDGTEGSNDYPTERPSHKRQIEAVARPATISETLVPPGSQVIARKRTRRRRPRVPPRQLTAELARDVLLLARRHRVPQSPTTRSRKPSAGSRFATAMVERCRGVMQA